MMTALWFCIPAAKKRAVKMNLNEVFGLIMPPVKSNFATEKLMPSANGESLEAAAFPLVLMLRPIDEIAGVRVREVSAKRSRGYVYDAPIAESITLAGGEFIELENPSLSRR